MISLIVLTSVAVLFVLFLTFQVWWRYRARDEAAHARQLIPVDLDAFENLTDPEEERFLRLNLSRAEFQQVQRSRIRAARMYVAALSGNAGLLMAVGQSARSHSNPEVAASGAELLQRAIRLKVWCMLSSLQLNAAMIFPDVLSPSGGLANQYVRVSQMAANLPVKMAA